METGNAFRRPGSATVTTIAGITLTNLRSASLGNARGDGTNVTPATDVSRDGLSATDTTTVGTIRTNSWIDVLPAIPSGISDARKV